MALAEEHLDVTASRIGELPEIYATGVKDQDGLQCGGLQDHMNRWCLRRVHHAYQDTIIAIQGHAKNSTSLGNGCVAILTDPGIQNVQVLRDAKASMTGFFTAPLFNWWETIVGWLHTWEEEEMSAQLEVAMSRIIQGRDSLAQSLKAWQTLHSALAAVTACSGRRVP